MRPFLDAYASDKGEGLIQALDNPKGTKDELEFLCWTASQALRVARAQWEALEKDEQE